MSRRRSLLRRVPWARFPCLRRSDFPRPRLARFLSLGASPRAMPLIEEETGSHMFLGDLLHTCPGLLTPARRLGQAIRCSAPTPRPRRVAFRSHRSVGPRDIAHFGAQFRGLHARCLRFTSAVACRRARLASGWWPTLAGQDLNPLGRFTWFLLVLASHGVLHVKACMSHGGRGGGEREGYKTALGKGKKIPPPSATTTSPGQQERSVNVKRISRPLQQPAAWQQEYRPSGGR